MPEIRPLQVFPGAPLVEDESQFDFSGGENSVTDYLYLPQSQASKIENLYQRRGGGLTCRKGFKDLGAVTGQGRSIFELDQALPTVLTYVDAGANWYEEQMQPNFRLFNATPGTSDAFYVGSREKFNQLVLNMLFVLGGVGNTFLWRVSDGAGGWIDKTASIVEAVANSKQMRGAAGEWVFSWPDFADWLPQQVETRQYQYWLQVVCNLGGTATGVDAFHGQRRVRGSMIGRRVLMTATISNFDEWPGFTLPTRSIEVWPTGQRIDRIRGVSFNDYFYYASAGQRPLQRWNGARGVTRAGGNNNPLNAGLLPPPAFSGGNITQAANPNAYAVGVTLHYLTSYEYGPEGILGESSPCAAGNNSIVIAGAAGQVAVNLANAIATAATREVHAIRVYATNDVTNTPPSERIHPNSPYRLISRILRDSATWAGGTLTDTFLPRTVTDPKPLTYTNTPPFKPKGVAKGGGRLWIWDDYNVAWSDTGRADAWDPFNTAKFDNVHGIFWRSQPGEDRMLVFHSDDISYIGGVSTGLPVIDFFYRGLGNLQADSITVAENKVLFMSRQGPAAILENDEVVLTGSGRVFESSRYWNNKTGERDFAQGAFFERRWWVPIDSGGTSQFVGRTACLDLQGPRGDAGAWSLLIHKESGGQEQAWGALATVHAPLDHALARQLILVGFPDANGSANSNRLRLIEYGTTDNWTTLQTDGQKILNVFESRGLSMRSVNRWKSYRHGHVRYRMAAVGAVALNAYLLADVIPDSAKTITIATGAAGIRDLKLLWTEDGSAGGMYRGIAAPLHLDTSTDSGFDLFSWWADAHVEDFSLL